MIVARAAICEGICNVRHVTEVIMKIFGEVMLGFQNVVVVFRVIPATLYDFTWIHKFT